MLMNLRIRINFVFHALQLRDGRQYAEVCDAEVGSGHVGCLLQEQVKIVKRLLQCIGLAFIWLLSRHQLWMLEICCQHRKSFNERCLRNNPQYSCREFHCQRIVICQQKLAVQAPQDRVLLYQDCLVHIC